MSQECRNCGKVFGGLSGFDAHRTGKYSNTHPEYGRKCMTDDELISLGYGKNERGVWKDQSGVWRGGRID